MSKYAVLASLIVAAQTEIFVACHVALINSDQADIWRGLGSLSGVRMAAPRATTL